MKFCSKCGKEIMDEAIICPGCGCAVETPVQKAEEKGPQDQDGMAVAIKIFLILGTVMQGFALIPLAWCLPITLSVFRKMKSGEVIGTGMKVCTLLFVSLVGGILLLCRSDKN